MRKKVMIMKVQNKIIRHFSKSLGLQCVTWGGVLKLSK